MRTTLDIPDEMYRRLKARAALDGTTMKQVLLRIVDKELAAPRKRKLEKLPVIGTDTGRKVDLTREQIDEAMFG